LRKKNKYMQFIGLYLAVAIGATFITQQVFWDQVRLILIYIPLMLVLIGYGLYEISRIKSFKFLQPIILLSFVIIFFASFSRTNTMVKENKSVLDKNLEGYKYYGFTPDWIHYFQISEWAAKNIPPQDGIICRKPSMSFIYSKGREFNGLYKLPMLSVDSACSVVRKEKADILIIDNSEMQAKKFPVNLYDLCRRFSRFMVVSKNHFYTIYEPTPDEKDKLLSYFDQYKFTVKTDIDAFEKELKATHEEFYVEDPDALLQMLKDTNSRYIILASLRAQPAEKNGNIIDTMQRLVYFIQLKYPQMFVTVYQVGTEDDEPAQLVKVMF